MGHRALTRQDTPRRPAVQSDIGAKPSLADVWSTIAPDAPTPNRNSIARHRSTNLRSAMAKADGALAVANRWADGRASDAETETLFAPFGEMESDGRYQVFTILNRYPTYADNLWSSALTAATQQRVKNVA